MYLCVSGMCSLVHIPLCQWHVFLGPHTSMSVAFLVAWHLTGTRRCSCSMAYAWNVVHHMSGCWFSIIGGSCHEYHFCCDKRMFVTCLSCKAGGQNVSFVVTKVRLSWQNFCRNKIVCHDKYLSWKQFFAFVATKMKPVSAPAADNSPLFLQLVTTLNCLTVVATCGCHTECAQLLWTDQ